MSGPVGIVAAGHPLTAEAGAGVLREGGNAVDAALAALLTSWVAEPLLSGPGAGGYMLVAGAGEEPTLLDFFVAAPGHGADLADRGDLVPVAVSFGDAEQIFNVGAAAVGVPGTPAGVAEAARRWGRVPLADLAAPAAAHARVGVPLSPRQAYVFEILEPILRTTPEAQAAFAPGGRALREGERFRSDELAETIERLGRDGAEPFYRGDLAAAAVEAVAAGGGTLTAADLARYAAIGRAPVRARYRGREVLTNPPPSAGGILLALALGLLDERVAHEPPVRPALADLVAVMAEAQAARDHRFLAGLAEEGFQERFLAASRLGSTTHVSVLDGDGRACSVTTTNGEGSGVLVAGTGIHLNNVMGEEDLSPLGFFHDPPGRRMPSMMAPTVVLDASGEVQIVLGSAGSNRIRSALLQTIVNVVDRGMAAADAVLAPRVHFEDGVIFAEPGIPVDELHALGHRVAPFRERNLFFGGVQAVERDPATGVLSGAGDPRRGGAAVAA
ncbi:MAG TPA: gamma-glutamyltransferase [Solirubrobacteraceae bacterium]|nr:gamma-glutamyltransferase [Solirubrobacteraceae bacterium]